MAHATRGRRTGTFEIQELMGVNDEQLTLTVRHAAAFQPKTFQLRVTPTPAARQLLHAMADSIKVADNGDAGSAWESITTVGNSVHWAQLILTELAASGVDDFSSPDITIPLLRSLYKALNSSTRRSACWLLARVVRANHPNGRALSHALRNTRFQVDPNESFTYDVAVSDAIEKAARGVYAARYAAQRDLFARLGHNVTGRNWLKIPAQDLIDWAHRAHPEVSTPGTIQPPLAPTYEQQVAWALTHPERFGYRKFARSRELGSPMHKIGLALYADNVLLTAALVVHCLGENSGYNYTVLLEKSIDSLIHLGPDHALERAVKSRNKLQDTRATQISSIFTPGGVVETIGGLTRFARHHRRNLTNPDGNPSTIAHRLYVEHCAAPTAARVLDGQRLASAWRSSSEWDEFWDISAGPRTAVTVRLSALRLVAQARAMGEGLHADVHGHSEQTKMHYSSHVLPGHVFNKHAVAAQDAFHDAAIAEFSIVAEATSGPAAALAKVAPEAVMDVEIGLCTSGGQDPDNQLKRCSLGIVACFTCPNGYRTVDHIPGLLGAVELGNIIERNDPVEWVNGQASHLRFYAQACLDQFSPLVVANVQSKVDLTPHVLIVGGMYMEMRHG